MHGGEDKWEEGAEEGCGCIDCTKRQTVVCACADHSFARDALECLRLRQDGGLCGAALCAVLLHAVLKVPHLQSQIKQRKAKVSGQGRRWDGISARLHATPSGMGRELAHTPL